MRDRLPYPEHFKPPTFDQWCKRHDVTDAEYEKLMTFWIAMRLRKCGLLNIMMHGK